jgi:hypothetical protein
MTRPSGPWTGERHGVVHLQTAIENLRAYFTELRYSIPEYVHPAGAATIHRWIANALDALNSFDLAEAERWRKAILSKVEQEKAWREENRRQLIDHAP